MACFGYVDPRAPEGNAQEIQLVPNLTLSNRQRKRPISLAWLRKFAGLALPKCCEISGDGHHGLAALDELGVIFVSNRAIAGIHMEFMKISGATDVITFEHGEIIASVETAAAKAEELGHTVEAELALYTVHGMLHLNGFDDHTASDATRMRKVQDRIWKSVLRKMDNPSTSHVS